MTTDRRHRGLVVILIIAMSMSACAKAPESVQHSIHQMVKVPPGGAEIAPSDDEPPGNSLSANETRQLIGLPRINAYFNQVRNPIIFVEGVEGKSRWLFVGEDCEDHCSRGITIELRKDRTVYEAPLFGTEPIYVGRIKPDARGGASHGG